ncbi:lipoprotein-anchoring transpeptidase ErfK/SrfK [Actinoallomurus bryophytorum]|uniref:Lipoprotein-anchoring transpeptidase ErfK/SrfK n=1 Tax=Actinoallomurus bryophytorum TaxID=1490222 RepID=A0A543CCA0_9ACTN|nr:Ig-like domain-containing protein [Actinoallomurus bryophytorum]TQL94722.1 lipoprotein-anchoring transpeptidase ErfK/SrfK [Actinoallomurus bryophytorum]
MRRGAAVVAGLSLYAAAGCGHAEPHRAATVMVVPANGARAVRPDDPVTLRVRDGRFRSVTLTDGDRRLDGRFSPDGTQWWPKWALSPGRAYRLAATVTGVDGRLSTVHTAFRTRRVAHTIAATVITPGPDATVGVGMPIMLRFTEPVQNRKAVERSLELRMSVPVTGAWHWFSATDVVFRPRTYWPAHTSVRLQAHLAGLRLTRGAYGAQDVATAFGVGDSHITVASARNHHQVVRINGQRVRRMPISMGKGGPLKYTTTSGVHLTMEKAHHVVMDSASVGCPPGCPDHYRHDVYFAVRISDSGEYEHSAPWSVGDQGSRNVSHGCINLGPHDARWFYRHTQPGDVVQVTGTRRRLEVGNGWGFWQLTWAEWLAGSRLGPTAGQGMPAPATGTRAASVTRP